MTVSGKVDIFVGLMIERKPRQGYVCTSIKSGPYLFQTMERGDQDYVYILDTLEKGQEKLDRLKKENQKLKEANDKLVDLIEKLETVIIEEVGDFDWDGSEYDYPGQWSPTDIVHEKNLDLDPEFDIDDLDTQISEAIKSLKRAQKFKNK